MNVFSAAFGEVPVQRSKVCVYCRRTFGPEACSSPGNFKKAKYCGWECYQTKVHDPKLMAARFWLKVNKTDGCWLWTGHVQNYGYGEFGRKPRRWLAHRYSYTLAHGEIPKGQLVLHRCDTPRCVRPEHLFLGTDADNTADKVAKGRHGGKLTPEQVREIKRELLENQGKYGFQTELARRYGVSDTQISSITKGKQWKHVP